MKTSIATVSISGNLREKLVAIAEAGYDGLEIFEQDFIADEGSPRQIGEMIRDHGLDILLFQPFRDFEGLPEGMRERAFARAERKFDLMQELGTDLMLICSNVSPKSLGGIDRAADDFRELGERAAKRGLRVGFEALAWGRHINDHRDAWEVVRRADHPNVGLILDSFHTLARKIDPDTIRRIPGDRIFFVQVADAPLIEMDLLYWSRHFRNMPGEGDLDVTGFMRAVAATGYDGPVSLEIFNDQFRGGSTQTLANDGHRSLVYLMDQVRRGEPGLKQDLPDLPDRVAVEGVEFIEFASQGEEAERLRRLLASMGFRNAGQHRSKQVEVWRQGGINIIVNTENKGYARSSFIMHGTGVCDVCLKVEDAAATMRRATALGAPMFEQEVGPGELKIPAIRSIAGSLMHFVDDRSDLARIWEIDFEATGDKAGKAEGAGLTRVDHLAETMAYDEMLSWSLFYTSIFDMNKAPMVDVIDPDGLVRSRALQSGNGRFRMTLNGAESHRTLAGHFLADSFGSAVQHIALATDDIFASVEAMNASGFEALPIPQNYYDDLEARFDMDARLIDRMQALNIIYDEDENGAFFQVYSLPYNGGLFFEILQRVDGYGGYGAPNAPFRIAAQKRYLNQLAAEG
jgi:4-hydroxyphenylpyruvate dioxygenase